MPIGQVSGTIRAIGAESRIAGFALAGVGLAPADTAEQARRAWADIPPGTALVLLTAEAADAIRELLTGPDCPLWAVIP